MSTPSPKKCQCGGKLKKVQYGYFCVKCDGWYPDNADFKKLKIEWEKEKITSAI